MKKIFVDFNNADKDGRIRLNTKGTLDDIEKKEIKLKENLEILLDDDDGLTVNGIVQFSEIEKIWVVRVNWDMLKKPC